LIGLDPGDALQRLAREGPESAEISHRRAQICQGLVFATTFSEVKMKPLSHDLNFE